VLQRPVRPLRERRQSRRFNRLLIAAVLIKELSSAVRDAEDATPLFRL